MRPSLRGVAVLAALVLLLCLNWIFRAPSTTVTSADRIALSELRSLREAVAKFPDRCRIAAQVAAGSAPARQLSFQLPPQQQLQNQASQQELPTDGAGQLPPFPPRSKAAGLSPVAVRTQIYEANKERQRVRWSDWDAERDYEQWTWQFYEVLFPCDYPERFGPWGDGGKWLCRPRHLIANNPNCLIYSFGSAANFDFERELLALNPACQIHVFDPTPSSVKEAQWQREQGFIPKQVHYHALALLPKDGTIEMEGQEVQGRTLSSLVKQLGHEKRTLDLLKVDIEGWEWTSLDFSDPFYAGNVMQFAAEVHLSAEVLSGQGVNPPHQTSAMRQFAEGLEKAGFELFSKEVNPGSTCCFEVAFVNRRFFPITIDE